MLIVWREGLAFSKHGGGEQKMESCIVICKKKDEGRGDYMEGEHSMHCIEPHNIATRSPNILAALTMLFLCIEFAISFLLSLALICSGCQDLYLLLIFLSQPLPFLSYNPPLHSFLISHFLFTHWRFSLLLII